MVEYTVSAMTTGNTEANPDYSAYAKYGLSFDSGEDTLYYQGKPVRVFEDSYSEDEDIQSMNFDGEIDVRAKRDTNGELTGLYVFSAEEFATRDLEAPVVVAQSAVSVEGGSALTSKEKQEIYGAYAQFGLIYDAAADTLTYAGQPVRQFTDIKSTNGEPLNSGRFEGVLTMLSNEAGEIDVETIRDYSTLDEAGNGTLMGLRADPIK